MWGATNRAHCWMQPRREAGGVLHCSSTMCPLQPALPCGRQEFCCERWPCLPGVHVHSVPAAPQAAERMPLQRSCWPAHVLCQADRALSASGRAS